MSASPLVALQSWYAQREPREQRILLFGSMAAVAILLLGGLLALRGSVAAAQARVERKQQDLAFSRPVPCVQPRPPMNRSSSSSIALLGKQGSPRRWVRVRPYRRPDCECGSTPRLSTRWWA
jgi:Type II secretion system (T2SS), protein M